MFLRKYTHTKAGTTHTYFALVESVRTEAGPRQDIVPTLANSTPTRNATGNARSSSTIARAIPSNSALFPDNDAIPLPDDPDVVRVRVHRHRLDQCPLPRRCLSRPLAVGPCSNSTPSSNATCPAR